VTHEKFKKKSKTFPVNCLLLPWSDGLTIPLLAKRASSAAGRGILQQMTGGFIYDDDDDNDAIRQQNIIH